jgi:hypothetical protein
VAGASIEAGVTKCVRVCWGGRRGGSGFFIVVQSGEGGVKPHRARIGRERSGKHWEHCRMRRKGAEGQTKYRSDGLCTAKAR